MLTVEELGLEIAELAVHLDAATHRLLECVRQFDAECGWAAQGAVSCAHWLAWRIGLDPATAREKVRVARASRTLLRADQTLKPALSGCPGAHRAVARKKEGILGPRFTPSIRLCTETRPGGLLYQRGRLCAVAAMVIPPLENYSRPFRPRPSPRTARRDHP
jgi:hypothetical protein